MSENMFDLIKVRFSDQEIDARPFDFESDKNGDLIRPIKASTSCPFCGHGQEVDLSNWVEGIVNAKCSNCGAGDEDFEETPNSLDANHTTVSVNRDIEQDILAALHEDDNENDHEDRKINPYNSGSITIDKSDDIQTLKSNCPFIDPIDLGLLTLDEI